MRKYRKLTSYEIDTLKKQMCSASDWNMIEVDEDFSPDYIHYSRFSGTVRLGKFTGEFELAGGMKKHAGLYHVTLHNVTVDDDCWIEKVKNYTLENFDLSICYELGLDADIPVADCEQEIIDAFLSALDDEGELEYLDDPNSTYLEY